VTPRSARTLRQGLLALVLLLGLSVAWTWRWRPRSTLGHPVPQATPSLGAPRTEGLVLTRFTGEKKSFELQAREKVGQEQEDQQLKGVALGATVLVLVGVLDDILEIRATWKLLAQGVAAAIAVNYGVLLTLLPYRTVWGYWGDVILTILWFVGITNALQFLDGMDGLASGLGVIAAFFFSMVALQTGQDYLMFLSAALLGACLGFLPYNFRPWSQATIFLGDAGSSFIGFTLAGLAVMGEWAEGNPLVALTTPLLILSVPIFDIAVVSTARVVTGRVKNFREWLAYVGKDHIHHRFVLLGLSKTRAVLLIHFLSISLGISALLIKSARIYEALLLLVQAACVLLIILILEATGRRGTPG